MFGGFSKRDASGGGCGLEQQRSQRRQERAKDASRHGQAPGEFNKSFLERSDGRGLIILYVEDGVELSDLQEVVDLLGKFQQLELATLIADGGERAHQLADARAVDVGDVAQSEQDLLVAFADQFAHGVAQDHAAFAQGDASAEIDDRYTIHLSGTCLHAHLASSDAFAESPRTCLTKVISVPGCRVRKRTSSMNDRMRKIPRPDCFSRFSGASGSGISASFNPWPSSAMVMTRESPVFSNETRIFLLAS